MCCGAWPAPGQGSGRERRGHHLLDFGFAARAGGALATSLLALATSYRKTNASCKTKTNIETTPLANARPPPCQKNASQVYRRAGIRRVCMSPRWVYVWPPLQTAVNAALGLSHGKLCRADRDATILIVWPVLSLHLHDFMCRRRSFCSWPSSPVRQGSGKRRRKHWTAAVTIKAETRRRPKPTGLL